MSSHNNNLLDSLQHVQMIANAVHKSINKTVPESEQIWFVDVTESDFLNTKKLQAGFSADQCFDTKYTVSLYYKNTWLAVFNPRLGVNGIEQQVLSIIKACCHFHFAMLDEQ